MNRQSGYSCPTEITFPAVSAKSSSTCNVERTNVNLCGNTNQFVHFLWVSTKYDARLIADSNLLVLSFLMFGSLGFIDNFGYKRGVEGNLRYDQSNKFLIPGFALLAVNEANLQMSKKPGSNISIARFSTDLIKY